MSEMGQTETSAGRFGMSGLSPIADIVRLHAQVRSVPTCDIGGLKDSKESRPKAALNSKLMIVDQATTNAGFDFRGQP
jgi:hypothetical protein